MVNKYGNSFSFCLGQCVKLSSRQSRYVREPSTVADLEKTNQGLLQRQAVLLEKVEELQQYSRRENILIHGLPASEGEQSPEDYALPCFKKFLPQVWVSPSDISVAHQIPAKGDSSRRGPRVVRFARRSVRNNILKLCKAKEVYATLRQNHLSFSISQALLKKAKALAAENRIVCCWVKDGQF